MGAKHIKIIKIGAMNELKATNLLPRVRD